MNRHAVQLIARGAIDKIGNMLYDYGNSIWLASMGTVGKTVLGIYQISELVTAILANPFGGVISDRFSRRKILMMTDLVCGLLCLGISFIRNDRWMIAGLIFANIVQAIAFAFSRPANKAIITEVVEKDEIVTYNAHLELVLQLSCVLFPCFTICQSPCDPLTGCTDLFHRLCPSGIPSERRSQSSREEKIYRKRYFFGY